MISITFAIILLALTTILAAVPAMNQKSWKRFVIGFILTPFAVILPLAFFFLSVFLTPDAKDVCHNGALDCFHTGKLALTPFVLWATTALYAIVIIEVRNPARAWITNGLILGAMISSVCTVFGLVTHGNEGAGWLACLLVPLYTSIWYVARAVHAVRTQPVNSTQMTIALIASLPFWALSILLTYLKYLSLPDHAQDCFVVTAASRGHRGIVGPHFSVNHRGRARIANQQLATLWAFEALWRKEAPRSHAAFRRVYNVVGPVIARRITSPWLADIFFIALKPAEFCARLVLAICTLRKSQIEPRYPGCYRSTPCARQS